MGLSVAVRVGPVPLPGAFDDFVQIRMLGLPAQITPDSSTGSDQDGRIARSPRPDDRGDGMTGDAARGLNHFKNRVTVAVAQIVTHK